MTSEHWPSVHVGRQAIQQASGKIHGYELLFRNAAAARVATQAGEDATAATILAAFSEFDIGDLLEGQRGFVNLSRRFITGELPLPFSPAAAGLEILETIDRDAEAIAGILRLADQGYQIVLDDFVWSAGAEALVEVAEIVKIDVLACTWDEVQATMALCRPYEVRFLAEKIEDGTMWQRCIDEGFLLFQGYHLGRPETLSARTLAPLQTQALDMLGKLTDPNVTVNGLSEAVRRDPALTYRLLRIANSAFLGHGRQVSSVEDALVLVGLSRLRAWVILMAMTPPDDNVIDIVEVLVRAATCERVAQRTGSVRPDMAFTLGLLDGLAHVLGLTAARLAERLPLLGRQLNDALHGDPGPMRTILDAVRAYEVADVEPLVPGQIPFSTLAESYLQALVWTTRTTRSAAT